MQQVPTLLTVRQMTQRHPAFSEGGLRWLLFHRGENGLRQAVVQCGRRVLIDEERFFEWLRSQSEKENGDTC